MRSGVGLTVIGGCLDPIACFFQGETMNRKSLGMAAATLVALATLSTSALALTVFGNNSQKGSLLIYPRVEAIPGLTDTLITLTNDSALPVRVKCYYATSDRVPTSNSYPAASLRWLRHFGDLSIHLTII